MYMCMLVAPDDQGPLGGGAQGSVARLEIAPHPLRVLSTTKKRVAGKKMELDSMGSLLNFDKMKEMGWRKTTIQDVAVMHGDESQVHVSAILERHMADGAIEETCSVFFLTKVDEYYRLMVGGNATAGGSTLVSAISGK